MSGYLSHQIDSEQLSSVKAWLAELLRLDGHEPLPVVDFTPESVGQLHEVATAIKDETRAAELVAEECKQQAEEYRRETERLEEILSAAGAGRSHRSADGARAASILAETGELLQLADLSDTSFVAAFSKLTLRRASAADRQRQLARESAALLEQTRAALGRLTQLQRMMADEDVRLVQKKNVQRSQQMQTIRDKNRQYTQQLANYQAILSKSGYHKAISHGALVASAAELQRLEDATAPVVETLNSYKGLPPDKALAEMMVEKKRQEVADADKRLDLAVGAAASVPY